MKTNRLSLPLFVVLIVGLAVTLAGQSAPQFLGTFSEPFTTFAVSGALAHPGELDWYTFDIGSDGSTIFILAESENSVRVLLFDSDETYLDTASEGYLEAALDAGTYLLRIDSGESAVLDYSLIVLNGVETETNDGLAESTDLGELSGSVQLFASMLPAGDADFYRFAVSESGLPGNANALLIRTSGPAGDSVVVLYQFNEEEDRYLPTVSDDDSGASYWSQLLVRPEPGDRFALRIEETAFPLEGIDTYSLSILPVALVVDEEPNNTSTQATLLVPINEAGTEWMVEGILDVSDTIDFFALTVLDSALVQIATEAQDGAGEYDTLLSLYTPEGDLLAESDDVGEGGWSRVSLSLEAGDYIVTIEMDDYETPPLPYRLKAVATSVRIVSENEPNDTDETSELVEWVLGDALLIEAAIGEEGDVDSFRFELAEATTVTFETGPRNGSTASNDTTLALYDADLWQIGYNDDAIGSWSRVEEALPAGTYYIVIEGYFGDETFDYSLLITSTD
jgi:hypothetical protein